MAKAKRTAAKAETKQKAGSTAPVTPAPETAPVNTTDVQSTEENEPEAGAGEAVNAATGETTQPGEQLPPVEETKETMEVTTPGGNTIIVDKEEDPNITEEQKENAVDVDWVIEKLSPYLEAYPDEKEFHITSDGQVFLKKNKADAEAHQKFLAEGELVSFTVEQPE